MESYIPFDKDNHCVKALLAMATILAILRQITGDSVGSFGVDKLFGLNVFL